MAKTIHGTDVTTRDVFVCFSVTMCIAFMSYDVIMFSYLVAYEKRLITVGTILLV